MSIFSVFALVLKCINISQYVYSYTTLRRNKSVENFGIHENRYNQADHAEGSQSPQIHIYEDSESLCWRGAAAV
jgi:hypothetical protein